jgi:hypothetical protein
MAYSWNGAPYPSFFVWFLANPQIDQLPSLVGQVLRNAATNAGAVLFSPHIEEFLQMLQLLALLLILGWRRLRQPGLAQASAEWELHLYQLGLIMLLPIVVYGVGNQFYRLVAPHLLLSLALLVWRKRTRLALSVVLPTLILTPLLLSVQDQLIGERLRTDIRQQVTTWRPRLADVLAYQPQPNRWCNTVTASAYYMIEVPSLALLASIPSGMGMSWVHFDTSLTPQRFRAGYLLLTDEDAATWADRLNVEPLLEVEGGTLYRNLDADCPS